jgi:hypothetical protein
MMCLRALLIVSLSLVLVVMLVALVCDRPKAQGTAYSVAVIQASLGHDPQAWVSRTLPVRATVEPCPWWGAAARRQHCADQPLVLIGTATDVPSEPLPLVRPAPAALWAILRRLPLVGSFVPAPPAVPCGAIGTYRVQLRATLTGTCPAPSCYEAVLLAAAP